MTLTAGGSKQVHTSSPKEGSGCGGCGSRGECLGIRFGSQVDERWLRRGRLNSCLKDGRLGGKLCTVHFEEGLSRSEGGGLTGGLSGGGGGGGSSRVQD